MSFDTTSAYKKLNELYKEYTELGLEKSIDFEKFNLYSLVHHSTTIEGSTLTEGETITLLEKGLTAHGKPLEHSLMVKDCYAALLYAKEKASEKEKISENLLKEINGRVNKSTGQILHTALGSVDGTKGEYRLSASHAQGGGYYLSHEKIPAAVKKLCKTINDKINSVEKTDKIYNLSFDLHFNLVTIHPWVDGNGRTSRIMMNYIQMYHGIPLSKVSLNDRNEYIKSFQETRKNGDNNIFRFFMVSQQIKFFCEKINEYKQHIESENKPGTNLLF